MGSGDVSLLSVRGDWTDGGLMKSLRDNRIEQKVVRINPFSPSPNQYLEYVP
jgi:hypothetical protein